MNKNDILTEIQVIFRDLLADPKVVIDPSSSMDTVEGWDSLLNINLILAIEETFSVRLPIQEMYAVKTVSDLMEKIELNQSK